MFRNVAAWIVDRNLNRCSRLSPAFVKDNQWRSRIESIAGIRGQSKSVRRLFAASGDE